mgnify:CR=1 FL=1|tara:strand:- start:1844 stop:5524 length:3681 start_codon:yes stop_codon:yes gene_type:complete
MSAVTQNEYTGNGSTTTYSFTFPYLKESDIKVSLDSVVTTAFTLPNATTIQFNTAPGSGVKIKIFRETSVDDLTATFYAGSAIKSEDLNDNFTQNLFVTQEVNQRAMSSLGATMTGALEIGSQGSLKFEGSTDDANETTLTVTDPTADRTITLPNESGEVVLDTLPSAKIFVGDNTNKVSEVTVTGDIAISNTGATTIQNDAVETSMIGANQVTTSEVDDSLTNTNIATNADIAVSKLAPGTTRQVLQTNSNADGVEFTDSLNLQGTLQVIGNTFLDANTNVAGDLKVLDSNTERFKVNKSNGEVTITASDATSAITKVLVETGDDNKIQHGNAASVRTFINVEDGATADQSDDEIKTAYENNADRNAYTDSEKNLVTFLAGTDTSPATPTTSSVQNQLNNKQPLDDELTTLSGMQAATASKLAAGTDLTSDIADLNIVDGMTKATSLTANSDTEFPTSKAVADHVKDVVDSVGGFKVIANKDSFPTSHPDPKGDAGMVLSLVDADGLTIDENGVSGNAQAGGSTVTITGFPTSVRGGATNVNGTTNAATHTLTGDLQLLVQTTTTLHTYTFYKFVPNDSDVLKLSDDINQFNARYRVGNSNPTNSLDAGDLFFNTATSKLLVYNATNSAWEEAQSIGNFFISTFSEAFDGSRTQFTLSNAPANVQQILLSINGVIQKPGTAFTLSGSTVTLASAPASGTEYFAVVMGSTVNIGQPSDNTVDTDVLMSGAVTNAKVSSATSDRIAGSKITPDFGSQNLSTTGTAATGALTVTGAIASTGNIEITNNGPGITFTDSDHDNDFYIQVQSGNFNIVDSQATTASPAVDYRLKIDSNGNINANGNLIVHNGYFQMMDQDIYIPSAIKHNGDDNTSISFPADDVIQLTTAGQDRVAIGSTEVVVNDPGNDIDFRVEGDTNTHALFVDASGDNVCIGTSTPGNSSADDLTIQAPSGSAGGITIRSDSDQGSYIYFADGTNGNEQYSGFIQYLHGSDYFNFGTAGQDRFIIGPQGQFGIAGTNYGNSGEALVSQGSGAAPQWASVSSVTTGTMTNVDSAGASQVFSGIPANATLVRVLYQNLYATGGGRPMFRVGHSGSGGTILTSGYKGFSGYWYRNSTTFGVNSETNSTFIPVVHGGWNHSSYRWNGYLELVRVRHNSNNTSQLWISRVYNHENNSNYWGSVGGTQYNVEFYNQNQIYMGDNIALDRIEVNANGSSSGEDLRGNVTLQYIT